LVVPVRNIGSGPAVRIEARVKPLNPEGGWSGAPTGQQTPGLAAGAGVSERIFLEVQLSNVGDVPGFELTLLYRDVADKAWMTVSRWIPDRERYEDVAISREGDVR
jgi:hypothetical protein